MKTMPIIELKDINKSFHKGKLSIFNELSLVVPERETIGIIGGNGSGKTTLIKIISGLVLPDSGQMLYRGEKVKSDDMRYRSHISVLVDANRSLYWNLTGI